VAETSREHLYDYLVARLIVCDRLQPSEGRGARLEELHRLVAWMGIGAELARRGAPGVAPDERTA
jgi:hypothetical protein